MVTLLETLEKVETTFNARDIHKLKYIYDASETQSYEQMKFEMNILLSILSSFSPKKVSVSADSVVKLKDSFEFNPTISGPNIEVKDSVSRDFSIWYKPKFFFPNAVSAKPVTLDFVISEGKHNSFYNFTEQLQKQLYQYEFLSYDALKEIASKMLINLKPIKMVVIARQKFAPSMLADIKSISYFLKPKTILLVSEDALPEQFKMSLPVGVSYAENASMNLEKIAERIKSFL